MKKIRKALSVMLVALMLLTSAPLQGIVGLELPGLFSSKVQATGVSGYNAVAAAEWAKAHVYDTWSCLYGQGYWEPGTGDCANFVSQCIYMGGVDQTDYWNHTGYKAHYSQNSNGSWIRASQLHDYVVSIGGVDIQNPSASQIEVGDLMFYKQNPGTSGFSHCAIVTDVNGGQVTVAAHTTNKICYTDTNWHLGFSNEGTHLVKMYGGKCTDKVIRDFDVYTAGGNANVYSKPSTSSTRQFYFFSGEYVHVYETRNINGVMWGYTCGYGAKFAYGWVKLSTLNYKCHVKTGPVSHIMGNWYVKVQPTCTTVGVEERVCSRCGYTEQRNMSVGGKHKSIIAADCLNPSYCTACGATISAALGHDWSDWSAVVKATCLEGGEDKRSCNRCGITENRTVNPLGHNHQPVVDIPTCVTDGTSTFECTRCGDSYIEESEWSAWTDEYSEQYFIDNLIPESMYEARTEYRYRDKKYTTEDSTSASLSKSGWNWYKSEHTGYTDYGVTQGPVYSDPGSSDTRKSWSESYVSGYGTTRHYYYFRYANSDGTAGSDAYVEGKYTKLQELDLTYALTNRSSTTGETGVKGWMVYYKSSNYNDSSTGNYKTYWYKSEADVKDTSKPIYSTRWYYQDRSKMYTNYFWQWSAWSDWSTTPYTETAEIDVEERIVYRVKQAALGHIWDDGKIVSPTCHEDGYTEYTCNRCGVSMKENIIPALGDLWGEKYLISEEGVTPRVYRQDCVRGCGCNCGCYKTFIEECEYEVTGVTEATCTEKGYTTYTCVLHGETYDADYVDALGHKEDGQWFVTKAPTCTESGEAMCKCVRHDDGVTCDKTYTRSIDAVGHSLVKTAAVAVTCEQDGNSEYYQCKICNKYFADSQAKTEIEEASWIITATGHNGKNVSGEEIWITELEASCGVTGRECLYCLNEWCDYESSCEKHTSHNYLIAEREIEEIAPDYAIVEHKDSTCIELGYDIWSCLNCYGTEKEHGWTEIINFMPHDWCDPIVVYATCTEGGTETIICNYCKREGTYGTGEATGHALSPIDEGYESSADKMELISSVANVCGEGSVDTYQCTHIDKNASARCTYTVTIGEAKEHSLGDYIITLEPTCTEEGYKHKECTNEDCGYRTADETIPSIGHDWNLDKTIEPTCETQGYDHYICKNDNSHVYDDNNKSMLGHEADNNWVVTKEPICAEKGEEQCECIRHDNGVTCSKIFTREIAIDPDAHDWDEWETVTPATCEEDGLEKRVCKNDASHVEENILPAINHKWDDGVIDPVSTCKTHGTKTYTCQNDSSHKKTEEVALDENNHVGETYIKDAKEETCTEDGYTGDTYCSDCDALLEKGEVIPATDHDWDDGVIDPASTCKTHGTKTYTCQNDSSHKKTEDVALDESNHVGETYIKDAKEETCTEDGYTGDTYCSDCNALLEKGEVIPATDHDWDEWETVTPATCEEDGLEKRVCKNDASHVEENILPAINHDYHKIPEKSKAPDYNEDGYDYFECSRDASHNYTVEVPHLVRTTFTATFITTAPFFEDDKVVAEVTFVQGDKFVEEPAVDKYDNYTFAWDEYELKDEDIVIYGRYTEIEINDVTTPEAEKKAEYKDGVATITLEAKANSKNIKILSEKTKPVDVVLVLDQSGSMAETLSTNGKTKRDALVECANDFVKELYDNAVATGAEHRVAVVGFSYSDYNGGNYKNTGILATTNGKSINYKSLKDADYASALMSVTTSDGINANITKGINSVVADGATSAHLGLEMANNIFAMTNKESGRERIVLFITDGTPTSWGEETDLVKTTAAKAITEASELKNAQGAKVYSIGVHANANPTASFTSDDYGVATDNRGTFKSYDFNRFLHAVSSNYPTAGSIRISEMGEGNKKSGYYLGVQDTSKLSEIFSKILLSNVYEIKTFDKVTIVDTVSKEFTLTYEQEAEMRERLISELGIRNEDISVIRNADGTTTIRFDNVRTDKVYNTDGSSYYSAKVSFNVSADKDSLGLTEVNTNTEDAGVEYDGEPIIGFKSPTVVLDPDRKFVVFTVNGVVYSIEESRLGDNIVAPESDLAKWSIPEGTVVDGDYVVFEADVVDSTEYIVTWISENRKITETYMFGEKINIPEAAEKEGYDFLKWSPDVPATMPDYNLIFDAVYTPKHSHVYNKAYTYGKCTEGITTVYECACGDSYEEKADVTEHNVKAIVEQTNNGTLIEKVTCQICGTTNSQELTYKVTYREGWRNTVLDLTLLENDVSVQPDGTIEIRFYVGENINKNYTVYRIDENGNRTSYTPRKENGYLIFDADHFSFYVVAELDEETGEVADDTSYEEVYCVSNGHSYEGVVTEPTCTEKGYTTYTCSVCKDSYVSDEVLALGHTEVIVRGYDATCTETGRTDGTKCSVCDTVLTEQNTIEKLLHNYKSVVTEATCENGGYTTFICVCGDTYIGDKTSAKDHEYVEGVCKNCGVSKAENCSCNCHKSGLMGIIWKIIRFFYKLFKINPVCSCGVAHY